MNGNGFHLIHEDSNGKKAGLATALDGCRIYVETAGSGTPILLVHGWTMSGAFWRHQMAGLRDRYQVVTMDLRAHGNSSKTMEGHTIEGYATDVRAVITALNLDGVVLAGWSLAGPVVLAYWRRFGGDRLSALALVEVTPFPFSPEEWNIHSLKNYNFEGMNRSFGAVEQDRIAFGRAFIKTMFKKGDASPEVLEWMFREHMKTPTPAAIAAYCDYLMGDYTSVLKNVSVPSLAVYGNSGHLCFGPKTGDYVSNEIPDCRLKVMEQSGHLPFFEEPEAFNDVLAELVFRSN